MEADPRLKPTGDCYTAAGLATTGFGGRTGWTLIHGRPTLQREPFIEYGHAWLESLDGEICWDPITDCEIPKVFYYAAGNIDPEKCLRYMRHDVACWVCATGHWGPWEGPEATGPLEDHVHDQ